MSSYYISFVNYLDTLGSLLISVHKSLGISARNKKYAIFLIIGRHEDSDEYRLDLPRGSQ